MTGRWYSHDRNQLEAPDQDPNLVVGRGSPLTSHITLSRCLLCTVLVAVPQSPTRVWSIEHRMTMEDATIMEDTSTMPSMNSPATSMPAVAGVAGRTNYAAWNKLTSELVAQTDDEDAADKEASHAALGLDGKKYAYSEAHAKEREKLHKAKQTKQQLEKYRARETALVQHLTQLLGPVRSEPESLELAQPGDCENTTLPRAPPTTVRITRDRIDAGKRVLTVSDTMGRPSQNDTIVITQDLSLLESTMKNSLNEQINARAKSYPDDAENDVVVLDSADNAHFNSAGDSNNHELSASAPPRQIFGLIKIFLQNLHHCTIWIKCKVISGTVEVHDCHHVVIKIGPEATVATLQIDGSSHVTLEFHDAPSGQNPAVAQVNGGVKGLALVPVPESQRLYWGDDPNDRIFHAGVTQLNVAVYRDGVRETEIQSDYVQDGAVPVGNATAEEYQFVTSVVSGVLVTEKVVRAGATTGTNARAMTERELAEETRKREQVALQLADRHGSSIKILDKEGNELPPVAPDASPTRSTISDGPPDDDEEPLQVVYGGMSQSDIDVVVAECEQNKRRGNEAFGVGEYAQAILLYSLALDKAAELPDHQEVTSALSTSSSSLSPTLFPRDVVYSNRAACFLKLGQHEKALQDATIALQLQPDSVKALFRQGLALHALGQYEQACPVLAQALQKEPTNQQIKQALKFAEVRFEQQMRKRMQGE